MKNISVPAVAAPIPSKRDILLQLQDRLAKATGPDRQIDARIALLWCADIKQFPAWILGFEDALQRDVSVGLFNGSDRIPRYTSSIDAAVTLVPGGAWKEVNGPRRYLHIPTSSPNFWHCNLTVWPKENGIGRAIDAHGWGATEALSVCLARVEYELAKESQP